MNSGTALHERACSLLGNAIEAQRYRLKGYEQPSEVLTLETVRAIDFLFCKDLFPEKEGGRGLDRAEAIIMSWGVNGALSRVFPEALHDDPFKLFPSTRKTQDQANGFLLDCGILALAERQAAFLRDGLLSASIDHRRMNDMDILVLSTDDASLYSEAIGHAGTRWASTQATLADRKDEEDLEDRHRRLLPAIVRQLASAAGQSTEFASPPEIDQHFRDWARIYLRRMPYRDLLSEDDAIGGRTFSAYLKILEELSTMAQTRLCYAGLLKHRYPKLSFRNLLTGFSDFDGLLSALALSLDADTLEVQRLLSHLMIEPANASIHLRRSETAWAPVMRTSLGACLLPMYGLEINPFLFLLNDLRQKYEKDWFRIANDREARWIAELAPLFPAPRWEHTRRGAKLKRDSEVVTDIDFAAYDGDSGELALFQLKWQEPVGADDRRRRSAGRNLLEESNRWTLAVSKWIDEFGLEELGKRLGFRMRSGTKFCLFVLARYGAHFSGFGGQHDAAVWADWNHFKKARLENISSSSVELARLVATEIASAKSAVEPESLAIPLPGLAVIVNPAALPGPRAAVSGKGNRRRRK